MPVFSNFPLVGYRIVCWNFPNTRKCKMAVNGCKNWTACFDTCYLSESSPGIGSISQPYAYTAIPPQSEQFPIDV